MRDVYLGCVEFWKGHFATNGLACCGDFDRVARSIEWLCNRLEGIGEYSEAKSLKNHHSEWLAEESKVVVDNYWWENA